jgi:RNA polymerase sigma factor (sigma-70 family)
MPDAVALLPQIDLYFIKNRLEEWEMSSWKNVRDYRNKRRADGSSCYEITIDGIAMEVDAELYQAYATADRRERYCYEREKGVLVSLEQMVEEGVSLSFVTDRPISIDDIVMHRLDIDAALKALYLLPPNERLLIEMVVMNGMPEREYADQIGTSQVAVHRRKRRTLKKIFCLMGY